MSRPATSYQVTTIMTMVQWQIGCWPSRWYVDYLRKRNITTVEASKIIKQLIWIKNNRGESACIPPDWEKIKPSDEELKAFKERMMNETKK